MILLRIEQRLTRERNGVEATLLDVLSEALPIDEQRLAECAFWMAFWGQVSADAKLRRLNMWVHREYLRLYERCFAEHWPEWRHWPPAVRDQVLKSVVTFINGLTAGAVTILAYAVSKRAEVALIALLLGFALPYSYASIRRNKRLRNLKNFSRKQSTLWLAPSVPDMLSPPHWK